MHREQLNIGEMNMKKLMMSVLLLGVLPFTTMAQDDDMYFVPSKESKAQDAYQYGMPSKTYYSGSSRTTDEYNRRMIGAVPSDSVGNDIIDFSAVRGVYPDSVAPAEQSEDYQLTRRMSRFDDYTPTQAYWDGYRDGRWSSPWYHNSLYYNSWYSWYDYDYWYWNSPWYYSGYGWTSPYYYGWYSPWYYSYSYPWSYGYYGYYGPRWYASSGRVSTHQGRRNSNVTTRTVRPVTTSRTTYENNNRSFNTSRSSSTTSSGSFGGSRSSGGSFGGGGSTGGGRSASGGRTFGGRR